jgi:hypothetical protein
MNWERLTRMSSQHRVRVVLKDVFAQNAVAEYRKRQNLSPIKIKFSLTFRPLQ